MDGVAIAIRNKCLNNITQIKRISNRIMGIEIEGNLSVINTYAPGANYNIDGEETYWEVKRTYRKSTQGEYNPMEYG